MFNRWLLPVQMRRKIVRVALVTEMMMKLMTKTQSMKIRAPKAAFCANVLQSLDITHPNLGFKWVRISLCCESQCKLARARPELEGQDTRHLTRASFLSLTRRSPRDAAILEMKKFIR